MRVKILTITRHNNRFRIGGATTERIPYDSENLNNRKQKNKNILDSNIFQWSSFLIHSVEIHTKQKYVRQKLIFLSIL